MKVIIFGATGMVGRGALREALLDPDVDTVLTLGRRPTGQQNPKLRELIVADLHDLQGVADQLTGIDACFFCLGVSSTGMSEAEYTHVTYDITVAAVEALARKNPDMTFIFVSGASTDGSERGSVMWARVKGRAENAVLARFPKGYAFRPAFIEPLDGIRSSTRLYNVLYALLRPLVPVVKLLFPRWVTSTRNVGRAMLAVAKHGAPQRVLENHELDAIGARG